MNIEIVLLFLGLLGIGGVVGGYLQHFWSKKRDTEMKIQALNENKYRSTFIFMRCVLVPSNILHFDIDDPNFPRKGTDETIKNYSMSKLSEFFYNSTLYASDDVLKSEREFLKNPSESAFFRTAIAMRKDLWKKNTKINFDELFLE
ncbi:MAG: hypothetical protein PHF74_05770 [Dehalococcoidales bacterium]|nr:hypothetical protein [Dehalococcoidales bacterium]